MKSHLNTLFVTTQGTYLSLERETLVVHTDGSVRLRIPLHLLEGIVCFGRVSISPFAMGKCAKKGIGISFLTERGRFLARVTGPVSGNVLLRREQYRKSDSEEASAEVARVIVAAKIGSSRGVCRRALRDHPDLADATAVQRTATRLSSCLRRLGPLHSVDSIRGIEGEAARHYFGSFAKLVLDGAHGFDFQKRVRRPPTDPVNALLSFVYVLLTHDVASALEAVGLDPQVGFLHRERPGRPSLALDLVEELRAFVGDRLVLSLINRRQVKATGFETTETGAVLMSEETRKVVLKAYQERKAAELTHPFLGEKISVGMIPHIQAGLLVRHLRGDEQCYPPFVSR